VVLTFGRRHSQMQAMTLEGYTPREPEGGRATDGGRGSGGGGGGRGAGKEGKAPAAAHTKEGKAAAAAAGAAKKFKCNSCDAEFEQLKEHREHFKTDWHRVNLKRKVRRPNPNPNPLMTRACCWPSSPQRSEGTRLAFAPAAALAETPVGRTAIRWRACRRCRSRSQPTR
jgi:hypothetical protein